MVLVSRASFVTAPDIDDVVHELRALHQRRGFELALAVGEVILERIFHGDTAAWHSRGRKDMSFRKLERHPDLPMRASSLCKSVAVYLLSRRRPDLLGMKHVLTSHVHEVIGVEQELQDRLLNRAEEERWSVQDLREQKRRLTAGRSKHQGRPRLPAFVKLLRNVRDPVDDRMLLADLDGIVGLDSLETQELLDTARRLCQQAESVSRQLAAHLTSLERRDPSRPRPPARLATSTPSKGGTVSVSTSKHVLAKNAMS